MTDMMQTKGDSNMKTRLQSIREEAERRGRECFWLKRGADSDTKPDDSSLFFCYDLESSRDHMLSVEHTLFPNVETLPIDAETALKKLSLSALCESLAKMMEGQSATFRLWSKNIAEHQKQSESE